MTLTELRSEMKQAMIAKNADRLSVIRMLISAVSYSAMNLAKKDDEMTEDDIAQVVLKEVKKRKESIADYEKANDAERAQKEQSELSILQEFAPTMMSEDDVMRNVAEIIGDNKSVPLGQAIGMVMKEVKNKADSQVIQDAVKKYLGV